MPMHSRIALCGVVAWLVLGAAVRPASSASIAIGAYGGGSLPIAQDDNGPGSIWGGRIDVQAIPLLTFEPYYERSQGDAVTQTINGVSYERAGIDIKSWGVNALLTLGGPLSVYPYAGVGRNELTRDGTPTRTLNGVRGGLGLGFGVGPGFRIDVRGEVNAIRENGFGRTNANATVGLSYRLWKVL